MNENLKVVETYTNKLGGSYTENLQCRRVWVTDNLMVGGSIQGPEDARHLIDDFHISAILNVETEHTDIVNISEPKRVRLLELPVWDHGQPILAAIFHAAAAFAVKALQAGRLYVHCQMGRARSPSFCYAILRSQGRSAQEALALVQAAVPEFMNPSYHSYARHVVYVQSVEAAFGGEKVRLEAPLLGKNLSKGSMLLENATGKVHELVDFTDDGSVLLKVPGTGSSALAVGANVVDQNFVVKVNF